MAGALLRSDSQSPRCGLIDSSRLASLWRRAESSGHEARARIGRTNLSLYRLLCIALGLRLFGANILVTILFPQNDGFSLLGLMSSQ